MIVIADARRFSALGTASLPIAHHDAHRQRRLAAGVDPEMIGASLHNGIQRLQLNRLPLVKEKRNPAG